MKQYLLLLSLFIMLTARAQVNTWLGNSLVWTNPANWSLGAAPASSPGMDVIIPTSPLGGNFPVISTSSPTIGNLTLQDGAVLTININTFLGTAQSISVTKSVSGGSLSPAQINGPGTVILNGGGPHQINNKLNLKKLRLNDIAGASLSTGAQVKVDSFIQLQSGVLSTTAGSLTLTNNAYINTFAPNTYTGSISGSITIQRYLTNFAHGYRNLSAPVATTVADLADDFSVVGQNGVQCWYAYSPYPNVQVYDEALSIVDGNYYEGWLSYTGSANPLSPMQGIAARTYSGSPFTIDFTGPPNDGPQSIGIYNTPSSTPSQDGWNLVGNPYPSAIRWSLVKALNAGETNGSYYAFRTTGEYTGNWGSHNGVTGVNGASDSIGIGQGFFVLATGNNTLDMNNSVRATSFSSYYKDETVNNEIRLLLSNGTNSDEVVAYTDAAATNAFDPELDAVKMPAGSNVYLSYATPDKEYAIQVLQAMDANTVLPLNVSVSDDGSYNLSAQIHVPGYHVYLRDALNNTYYDLTAPVPSFTLLANQNYSGRFSVVMQEAISGIVQSKATPVRIYAVGKEVYIDKPTAAVAEVIVSNVMGQQLTAASLHSSKGRILLPNHYTGYVIVKVVEGSQMTTQKLFIH